MTEPSIPDSAPAPIIADLDDIEHIEFIKAYQTPFDAFYATSAARIRGSQKLWVIKNVMGDFQDEFGPCSSLLLMKVDRYLRNHSKCNQKTVDEIDVPAPAPRAVSWPQVMADDRSEDIKGRIADIRKAEGVSSSGDYLRYFHRARQEIVDSLPTAEVEQYKELARAETKVRKAPPTPAAVFELQPVIATKINSAIRQCLGWEAGQFGDAVCYFGIAYRTRNQDIKSQFSVVSNHHLPRDEMIIPVLTKGFRKHVNPALQVLANKLLPRLGVQLPQLEINTDEMPPKVLREKLMQYIVALWVASSTDACRTAENLPWEELSTRDGQELYLINCADFAQLGFFNPTSMPSHDTLCKFTEKLTSICTSPLFKPPSTPGAPLEKVTLPLSPLHSFEQDLPDLGSPIGPDDVIPDEHEQPGSDPTKAPHSMTPPTNPMIGQLPFIASTPPPTGPVVDQLPPLTPAPPPTSSTVNEVPSFTSAPPALPSVVDVPVLQTIPTITETPRPQDSGDGTLGIPPVVGENDISAVVRTIEDPGDDIIDGDVISEKKLGKRKRGAKPGPVELPKKVRTRATTRATTCTSTRTSTRITTARQQTATTSKLPAPSQKKSKK